MGWPASFNEIPAKIGTGFFAEVSIIDLGLSPQNAGLLPLGHGLQDLVAPQPGLLQVIPR